MFSSTKRRSLKFEISLINTFIMGLILVLFCTVIYAIIFNTLYSEIDNQLKHKSQEIQQTIRAYLDVHGKDPESQKFAFQKAILKDDKSLKRWWMTGFDRRWAEKIDELDLGGYYVNIVSKNKSSLFRSVNMQEGLIARFLENVQLPNSEEIIFTNIDYEDGKIRIVNSLFLYEESEYVIQMGRSFETVTILLQNFVHSLAVSVPVILLLVVLISGHMADRIIKPVEEIITAAENISHEDLSARVEEERPYVEMKHLMEAFNSMIDRLQKSFTHITEFSSHVAHELKTPLSIIRGEAELALRKEREKDDYKNALRINLEESERMLKIIEELLLMTTADYIPENFSFKNIDFNEFMAEVHEKSKILSEPKHIQVILEMKPYPMLVKADALHLRRLFLNLIDNAIKVSPQGSRIYITAGRERKTVVVAIIDAGKGIPEEEFQNIFKKFYQSDNQSGGRGLGLNIAQSIAKMHRGEIEVKSIVGEGSTFRVALPAI